MIERMKKKQVKANHGGVRLGAGRPKGSVSRVTKETQVQENMMKMRILQQVNKILSAQFHLIEGCSFLFKKEKNENGGMGKAERVVCPKEIQDYLDGNFDKDVKYYYITADRPDIRAIEGALNRVFGKPTETHNHQNDGGEFVAPKIINVYEHGDKLGFNEETDSRMEAVE